MRSKLVVYGFHSLLAKGTSRAFWPRLLLSWPHTPQFDPLRMTNSKRSVLAFNLSCLFRESELLNETKAQHLLCLDEGSIAPPLIRSFPPEEVAAAHREIESGLPVGKVVLVCRDAVPGA